jgi:hypothetical protein
MKDMRNKVSIGSEGNNPKYSYINGYYEAGKILVDKIYQTDIGLDKNSLFYPICFNYRHYIELHLKSLIEDSEILYNKMVELNYLKNGNLPKEMSKSLGNEHSLNKLLTLLKERLHYIEISDEEFPKDIEKLIEEMHNSDSNSQQYRYHKDKKGHLSFPNEKEYNVANISNGMKEVHDLLWGIDGHIDNYISMSEAIVSIYNEEMSNNY